MISIRIPGLAGGAVLGALIAEGLGMWEPGLGFWPWEPLVATGGPGILAAEIAAMLADTDDRPDEAAGETNLG